VLKVDSHIFATRSPKAPKVLVGGHRHALGGRFFEPTVLPASRRKLAVAPRRNLRPGRAALPVQDGWEAVAPPNDTEFGLAAYFYGRDMARMLARREAL